MKAKKVVIRSAKLCYEWVWVGILQNSRPCWQHGDKPKRWESKEIILLELGTKKIRSSGILLEGRRIGLWTNNQTRDTFMAKMLREQQSRVLKNATISFSTALSQSLLLVSWVLWLLDWDSPSSTQVPRVLPSQHYYINVQCSCKPSDLQYIGIMLSYMLNYKKRLNSF